MSDKFVAVQAYSQPLEADIARSALEAAGIPATVADTNLVNMNWLFSNAVGGVKLLVPESYAEEARAVLTGEADIQTEAPAELPDLNVCPECGGSNTIDTRRGRRWTFLTWLLAGVPLFYPPKGFRCRDCGSVWRERISRRHNT
ncbi:MAG: DUF2007 domain-containing protein [bacterium]|nr:DUF2007 domain-containing protein [bacterium]